MELGTSYRYQRSGVNRPLLEIKGTFQYVPLIQNLQWLLQNKDIYSEVFNYEFILEALVTDDGSI